MAESWYSYSRFSDEIAFAALLTGLLYFLYRRYPTLSTKLIGRLHDFVPRITPCVVAAMLLPLALRLALLPWLPPPVPRIPDEFGHLLVADTLASGRLANPPHPLWRHLETLYVLQQPTYASIYPIGQGSTLAAGQILAGNPWAGVLLATVLMSGATSWMLFGCLPPRWAAVGGLLAALDYGLASQWVDYFRGGAFCAFGGALLFGALCRLHERPSRSMGLVAGLGWSIVWLTRPFESLLLFLLIWGLIAGFMLRDPRRWKRWLWPTLLALSLQVSAGCVTALHNRAITGSALTMPYHLSQQAYGVPQTFLWQPAAEEPAIRFPEMKAEYWFQRQAKEQPILSSVKSVLYTSWEFFVTPWYSVPLLISLFLWHRRDVLLCVGIVFCVLAASVLYPFFYPQYIAAYCCIVFFLIMRGLMAVFHWSVRGRAAGRLVALFLMLGGFMMGLRIVPIRSMLGLTSTSGPARSTLRQRALIAARLKGLGEKHVVFVRYGSSHNYHQEWVYNSADIDASRIVWCRAMGPDRDPAVAHYYRGRRMWVVDVDKDAAMLSRYEPELGLGVPMEP